MVLWSGLEGNWGGGKSFKVSCQADIEMHGVNMGNFARSDRRSGSITKKDLSKSLERESKIHF
jgi:hypothetical protein